MKTFWCFTCGLLKLFFSQTSADLRPSFSHMSVRLPAGSETSTLSSTSFDDISSDGSKFELSNTGPPSPVLDLEHQGQTYGQQYHSTAEIQHQVLRDLPDHQTHLLLESFRPIVPPRRCRMNLAVVVDLEALLPDGILDFSTGQRVVNLDSIHILTFTSYNQLQDLNVDYIKWAIQDLSWESFGLQLRKRDFKLWLQVHPPSLPTLPYGQFEPLDYDNLWIEVLNAHQIPFGQNQIYLRAHHPESIFDWLLWSSFYCWLYLRFWPSRVYYAEKISVFHWLACIFHLCFTMSLSRVSGVSCPSIPPWGRDLPGLMLLLWHIQILADLSFYLYTFFDLVSSMHLGL